jgi:hypothetical protein
MSIINPKYVVVHFYNYLTNEPLSVVMVSKSKEVVELQIDDNYITYYSYVSKTDSNLVRRTMGYIDLYMGNRTDVRYTLDIVL